MKRFRNAPAVLLLRREALAETSLLGELFIKLGRTPFPMIVAANVGVRMIKQRSRVRAVQEDRSQPNPVMNQNATSSLTDRRLILRSFHEQYLWKEVEKNEADPSGHFVRSGRPETPVDNNHSHQNRQNVHDEGKQ